MTMNRKPTVTLDRIQRWRKERYDAGLPHGLDDFYEVTGTCRKCNGSGEVVDGRVTRGLLFNVTGAQTCLACHGSGNIKIPS